VTALESNRLVRTIAILPVKTFVAAKQRLSGMLGAGSRQALAQAMFTDVLTSLRHVRGFDEILVVTDDPLAESTALSHRVRVLRDDVRNGQSPAAMIGIGFAHGEAFERALLVPGDTPLLDPREVEGLLAEAERRRLATLIVPDRHGTGTNALLLAPPGAIEPSFGPGSLERHLAAARAAAVPHDVSTPGSLTLDVDTPDDLAELSSLLENRRGRAQMTRGILAQLARARTQPKATASA
jgi:2-phospho-L-lactate/phosphoenolpyruvate guanylyltransferase